MTVNLSLSLPPQPPAPWIDIRTGVPTPPFYRFLINLLVFSLGTTPASLEQLEGLFFTEPAPPSPDIMLAEIRKVAAALALQPNRPTDNTDAKTVEALMMALRGTSQTDVSAIQALIYSIRQAPPTDTLNMQSVQALLHAMSRRQDFVDLTGTQTIKGVKTFTTQLIGRGTSTNDNAAAGQIGEFLSASATGVAISTGTPTNIVSQALTAGDWYVEGNIEFDFGAGASGANLQTGFNTTSATNPASPYKAIYNEAGITTSGGTFTMIVPPQRFSLSASSTVYLVGYLSLTGTCTAAGYLNARRQR